MKYRICFLGTPEFAAQHLQALLEISYFEVVGVITQPDRPSGRKLQMMPSAVKVLALKNKIPVLTPENLRKESDCFNFVKTWGADIAVVVAFGQILSQSFLDSFKYGAVNIHGSLLPRYRGAAPIQRCLANGDSETGVSLQKMVFKLDAGAVISERKFFLNLEINATELYQKLSELGCEILKVDLIKYMNAEISPQEQDESFVSLAPKILKEESLLNFECPALEIHNKIRAFSMGPGTYIFFQGKRLKIHQSKVIFKVTEIMSSQGLDLKPGKIVCITDEQLILCCGKDFISILNVQPESKSRMTIQEFLKSLSQSLQVSDKKLKNGDYFK